MEEALAEARAALFLGEVPVGCVIQSSLGHTLTRGSNRTNERGDGTAHAEMLAIEALTQIDHTHDELTLYVTCEPCVMCAAAIVFTPAIKKIVFGCENKRFGGCGSVRQLDCYIGKEKLASSMLPELTGGVCAQRATALLAEFYEKENPFAPTPKRRKTVSQGEG